jgi:branched-chain amino acid aminotransferase
MPSTSDHLIPPDFPYAEPVAWINGQFVPQSQAALSVTDLGIVGGLAVTEMSRTFGGKIFRLEEHLQRLAHSLEVVEFAPRWSLPELASICEWVVEHNVPQAGNDELGRQELGLILFVTAGLNPTYVGPQAAREAGPSVGIHTFVLQRKAYRTHFLEGVSLVCPDVRALPAEVVPRTVKSRSRLHWRMGEIAARKIDPQAVGILADADGSLTETAAGNLVVIHGQTAISPSAGQVLEGISLRTTLEFCQAAGMTIERRRVLPADLANADEAWLTSTPSAMLPVTKFAGQPIGTGRRGPLYDAILHRWSESTGCDLARWLGSD